MSDNWVEGTYESGADEPGQQPGAEGAGVEVGRGAPSTFEPEEDPGSVQNPPPSEPTD